MSRATDAQSAVLDGVMSGLSARKARLLVALLWPVNGVVVRGAVVQSQAEGFRLLSRWTGRRHPIRGWRVEWYWQAARRRSEVAG